MILPTIPTRRLWLTLVLGLCSLMASGCGSDGNAPINVRGLVKYKDQPLSNGLITFNPVDPKKGHVAQGKIGTDGTFSLSTFQAGDGVLAGNYVISMTSIIPGSELLEKDRGTGIGGKSAIPEKFADPKKSQLQQTIAAGDSGKVITLDLKD